MHGTTGSHKKQREPSRLREQVGQIMGPTLSPRPSVFRRGQQGGCEGFATRDGQHSHPSALQRQMRRTAQDRRNITTSACSRGKSRSCTLPDSIDRQCRHQPTDQVTLIPFAQLTALSLLVTASPGQCRAVDMSSTGQREASCCQG